MIYTHCFHAFTFPSFLNLEQSKFCCYYTTNLHTKLTKPTPQQSNLMVHSQWHPTAGTTLREQSFGGCYSILLLFSCGFTHLSCYYSPSFLESSFSTYSIVGTAQIPMLENLLTLIILPGKPTHSLCFFHLHIKLLLQTAH